MNKYGTQRSVRLVSHTVAVCVHCITYFCLLNIASFVNTAAMSEWLLSLYRNIGFSWTSTTALMLTVGLLSSAIVNAIRRISEGITCGWPQYKFHNVDTCIRAWIRLVLYMAFLLLIIGVYGELHSRPRSYVNSFSFMCGTYVFGCVVDVIDDAVSSLFVVLHGRKQ